MFFVSLQVIMRVKKRDGGGQRPWSVSGSMGTHDQNDIILPHSISESAIHQLGGTPTHWWVLMSIYILSMSNK